MSWWERLLLAPNRVNYHLEHHLLMTVPHYKLPRLHRMLDERGLLDGALVTRGYRAVLERAASKREAGTAPPQTPRCAFRRSDLRVSSAPLPRSEPRRAASP